MSAVTILLAKPANGVSPSGTLTNTTGLVRLSVAITAGTGPASYQLIKQNADSTAWYFVPNAVLNVDDGSVGQLNWEDLEGNALYHVVQTRPSGQSAVLTGASGYLSASSVISQSVGAVTTTTLTASGAIVGQSTLAITGAATLTGAVTMSAAATVGTTLGVTGAATLSSTLSVAGALTASAALTVGTTLGVTGAATLSSTLAVTGAVTHSSTLTQTGIATFNAAPVFAAGATASGAVDFDLSGSTAALKTPSGLTTITGDLLMTAAKVVGFGAPQALSGAGAVNVTTLVTLVTSTGAGDALTMADGTRAGQLKFVSMVVDGGSSVLTPTTKTNFTTLTLTAAYDWGLMQWSGTAWRPVAFGGTAAFA